MSTYVIGDVQGCFDELQGLLRIVNFNEQSDVLWFVGDLVNRGPKSLETLRFIKALPHKQVVLGNHDLHLLAAYYGVKDFYPDDTIQEVLTAPDAVEIIDWLARQPLVYYAPSFDVLMVHAGVAPQWTRAHALTFAQEVSVALQGEKIKDFLQQMYGNEPSVWSDDLTGYPRLRVITNYLTRMRFCDELGHLNLSRKTAPLDCPEDYKPWFKVKSRKTQAQKIVFGHWSALQGQTHEPNVFALDTGVIWGGALTALRLDDFKRFQFLTTQSR